MCTTGHERQHVRVFGENGKSNSTAGAVRVEANLPGIIAVGTFFFIKYITGTFLTLKWRSRSGIQPSQRCQSMANMNLKVIWHFFALALTVSKIIKFKMCDVQYLDQDLEVQHSHDATQYGMPKSINAISRVSEILAFDFKTLNWGQGYGVEHSQWFHSMINIKLYKCRVTHFCAISHRLQDISIKQSLVLKM